MEEVNTINNIASENVDFSMFALFMSADLVVKSVIIILILASIYSWTIIVSKLLRLRQLKQMEKDGLVHRKQFDESPPKVEYSLTQHAQKLKPILEDLCRWNKSSMNPPE